MSRATTVNLDVIDVAKPCPADWDAMRGDGDRVRFCRHCSLNVYNLSAMSRDEAEQLIARTEGRLCVRFYRREDGTVTTQDCDGWWRLARRRVGRLTSAMAAVLLGCVGLARWSSASATPRGESSVPVPAHPEPRMEIKGELAVMGKIGPPPASQPAVFMGRPALAQPPIDPPPLTVPPTPETPTTQPAK